MYVNNSQNKKGNKEEKQINDWNRLHVNEDTFIFVGTPTCLPINLRYTDNNRDDAKCNLSAFFASPSLLKDNSMIITSSVPIPMCSV